MERDSSMARSGVGGRGLEELPEPKAEMLRFWAGAEGLGREVEEGRWRKGR
jgi:hypothetical protein